MVKISKRGVRPVSALRPALALLLAAALLPAPGALASTASMAGAASAPDVRPACSATTPPGYAACQALVRTDAVTHAGLVRDSAPAGYGPAALRSAYGLTQAAAAAGHGQTVAVVDAYDDPNAASDLALYRSQYHLPACTVASGCFRKVNSRGQASPLPRAAGKTGWDQEESLDLDMVSAICPNCRILLVEADSAKIGDLGTGVNAAVALGAKFVSNSYSGAERPVDTKYDSAYFSHPGVAVTAAAGDTGYHLGYPAASRYVTSVGGTSLVRRPSTARGWAETVWNNASGATGAGCSAREPKPSWQPDTGCARRTGNDVAAIANPDTGVAVYNTYGSDNGWQVFGGTSVATPIIAATYALAGPPGSGVYPARYPYLHTGRLHDVTSGDDGSCGSYLCTARAGYDGPTGWGTPNGTGAFQATDHKVTLTRPGAGHSTRGKRIASLRVAARDTASGRTLRYTATGMPPGLSISSASGAISGTPKARGHYSVIVHATDGTGMTGSVSFPWVVASVGAVRSQLAGKCLDDRHGGTANGTRIQVLTCDGGQAQVWTAYPNAAGRLQLRLTKATPVSKCLTVPGSGTAAGARVELQRCTGSAGQEWQARSQGHLVNPHSGQCLADPGSTQLAIEPCAVGAAQHWALP